MYGVVLMMALSGGGDVPAVNDGAVDHVALYGDHGQKEYRHRRGGGCCGSSGGGRRAHGCHGGGYGGCSGGMAYAGCYGGGYGGCSGGMAHGGYGSWGGGSGYSGTPYSSGYYGGYTPYPGGTFDQGERGYFDDRNRRDGDRRDNERRDLNERRDNNRNESDRNRNESDRNRPEARAAAPATILVRLPADARLTIDGNATQATEETRTFVSPPLPPGKDYQYTLRAETTRDGKKVQRTREVTVRAGQMSEVTFDLPSSTE